jgi:hypothetical protein
MTGTHTGDIGRTTLDETFTNIANEYAHICNHSLYKDIRTIPWGKQSIHDIRLRFEVPKIWDHLKSKHTSNSTSKDILFLTGEENNIKFSVTVHVTDTISISLGCTYFPIEIDVNGIMRLWNTLAIIEERMRLKVDCDAFQIPNHKRWVVTLWHFGQDALITYAGKKYDVEFGIAKEILLRIYTKEWNNGKNKNKNKKKVRIELQEYPMKTVEEAIGEKNI